MTTTLRLGQILKGTLSTYTLTKQLQGSVWLATNLAGEKSIIKSVRHRRLENERDVLKRFQGRAPGLRELVDEIEGAEEAPAIVLKHLDDDALNISSARRFTRAEVTYVAKTVLEALEVLHGEGFVHTDIKPDNILVNYSEQKTRVVTARLADLGNTVPNDSEYARDGFPIGAPIFRSSEAALRLPWGCATDIWSLGTTLISLIWGLNFHIFKPDVPFDHEEHELEILMKHCQFFGPYPLSYKDLADLETQNVLAHVMNTIGGATTGKDLRKPFYLAGEKEILKEDREFLGRVMKLDPRDRPTARELLGDKWFEDPGDDFPSGRVDAMDPSLKQPGVRNELKRLWVTKLSLRCISSTVCLIAIGFSAATHFIEIILLAPASIILVWNTTEGIALIVRRRVYKGILPGVCVGVDLLLWLALGVCAAITGPTVGLPYHYYTGSYYYSYDYYSFSTYRIIAVALSILATLLQISLFIIACVETHRRRKGVVPFASPPFNSNQQSGPFNPNQPHYAFHPNPEPVSF
ncbi:hypothetical protein V491_09138, partial [Pseudogymnoascus sp. VKM F-3775]